MSDILIAVIGLSSPVWLALGFVGIRMAWDEFLDRRADRYDREFQGRYYG